jgi:hypothetical protein
MMLVGRYGRRRSHTCPLFVVGTYGVAGPYVAAIRGSLR